MPACAEKEGGSQIFFQWCARERGGMIPPVQLCRLLWVVFRGGGAEKLAGIEEVARHVARIY
ncbi:MAG: hypothetical protein H7836_09145 [Magnetococcus sp. YQC-3]